MVNWSRHWSIGSTDLGTGQPITPYKSRSSQEMQKIFSLQIGLHSQSMAMPSQSRSDRGLIVTYHAFIAQWLVNQSTLISTNWGYFLTFLPSRLKTYKLQVLLHLWVREHLHLFVYLLVLDSKALILSLVH